MVICPATEPARIKVPDPSAQVLRHPGIQALAEAVALLAAAAEMVDLLLETYKSRG